MKKYLITSPLLYGNTQTSLLKTLKKNVAKHKPDYLLYRDKENTKYDVLATSFVEYCKNTKGLKSFLHQKVALAKELGADGVHLTSLQFDKIVYAKSLGLEVIVSTHTLQEVLHAQELGADAVSYSPVFFSPNKGIPKGIEDLQSIVEKSKINIFALGGIIEESQVEEIKKVQVFGFASIRYFD